MGWTCLFVRYYTSAYSHLVRASVPPRLGPPAPAERMQIVVRLENGHRGTIVFSGYPKTVQKGDNLYAALRISLQEVWSDFRPFDDD